MNNNRILVLNNKHPFYANRKYQGLVNDIFKQTFSPSFYEFSDVHTPKVNIKENENEFQLDLHVSGFSKENFKIDILKNTLLIEAESKIEQEDNNKYVVKEFGYSSFKRSFQIPKNIDKENITANYKNGILSIVLPKQQVKEEKVRSIEVK